jgi:hypothetical protein
MENPPSSLLRVSLKYLTVKIGQNLIDLKNAPGEINPATSRRKKS